MIKNFNPYITSPSTELWQSLSNEVPETRAKILEDLWVYDYAVSINNEIDEIRSPKWAIEYCKKELNQSNHPLATKIIEWIDLNELNAIWFQEKFLTGYLQLVDDWLSVRWIVVLLEDEIKEDWRVLFNIDEMNAYTKNPDKKTVRNWDFILKILPWDDKNKLSFLRNVLWLKESQYWAVTGYTNMAGCLELREDYVRNTCSSWGNHALRCVKRKGCSDIWWVRFC